MAGPKSTSHHCGCFTTRNFPPLLREMMAKLPEVKTATQTCLDLVKLPNRRGNTIPMSAIGDPCKRKLWFILHWVGETEELTIRLKNIFATGTRAEEFIIEDLQKIGIKITSRQEELWGFMKHAHGFTDGRCDNVPDAPKTQHLLEIKTHNDKNFKLLVKNGVQKAFPKHYAQCHRYMIGLELKRTLYVGYNKNTSEYHIERIRFDSSYAADLLRIERDIILSENVPVKMFDPSWHECKYCDFYQICHYGGDISKNCRTCIHSDLGPDGKWLCCVQDEQFEIPREVQLTGCDLYTPMRIER